LGLMMTVVERGDSHARGCGPVAFCAWSSSVVGLVTLACLWMACTYHVCNGGRLFREPLQEIQTRIRMGDNHAIKATKHGIAHVGNYQLPSLFVPEFRISLLSIPQLDSLGWTSSTSNGICSIYDPDGVLAWTAVRDDINPGLFTFSAHGLTPT
jgi:hypothetical protein